MRRFARDKPAAEAELERERRAATFQGPRAPVGRGIRLVMRDAAGDHAVLVLHGSTDGAALLLQTPVTSNHQMYLCTNLKVSTETDQPLADGALDTPAGEVLLQATTKSRLELFSTATSSSLYAGADAEHDVEDLLLPLAPSITVVSFTSVADLIAARVDRRQPTQLMRCCAYVTAVTLPNSVGAHVDPTITLAVCDKPSSGGGARAVGAAPEAYVLVPADAVPMMFCGVQLHNILSSQVSLDLARRLSQALVDGVDCQPPSRVWVFMTELETIDSQGYALHTGPRFVLRNMLIIDHMVYTAVLGTNSRIDRVSKFLTT